MYSICKDWVAKPKFEKRESNFYISFPDVSTTSAMEKKDLKVVILQAS